MTRAEALNRLRTREADLRAIGIERLSIFGSTARDEARADSDLDLAVSLRPGVFTGLAYFGLGDALSELIGAPVDVVTEPVRKLRLQMEIDRDRVLVF